MLKLFQKLQTSDFITHLESQDGRFVVQDSMSMALIAYSLFIKKPRKILINCPNLYQAQDVYEHLINLLGDENLLFFPQDEVFRIDINASSKEMLSQRLYVMEEALRDKPKVLITHSASLTRLLPSVELFRSHIISLEVGQSYDIKEIINKLTKQGYVRVNKIDGKLQYALRGDILDISPIDFDNPFRIEFFDDEIESIRFFDISSQLSNEEVNKVNIYPASDILLTKEEKEKTKNILLEEVEKSKKNLEIEHYLALKDQIESEISDIDENGINESFYKYLSLIQEEKTSINDYFKAEISLCFDKNQCYTSFDFLNEQAYAYFSELHKVGRALSHYEFFNNINDVLSPCNNMIYTYANYENKDDLELPLRTIPEVASNIFQAIENIKNYQKNGKKVIICLNDQYDSFKEYLNEFDIKYKEIKSDINLEEGLSLIRYNLSEGIDLYQENIVYLSKKEIYGYRVKVSKFLHRYRSAKALKSYNDLVPGDYVVHEECGIGQFEEIVNLEIQGVHKDFIKIKYAGTGVLYVPLEQFSLVRKYISKEGAVPKLNKIGGTEWAKTKQKIKQRVNDLAERLIKLYAERASTPGFACKEDDEFQYNFERAFPYVLTEDQEKAIEEIKKDMESTSPMDRLLCGDVGFGKTEVAFRAAFKAIINGGQVALLCPTTLLCRQHYQRALERFSLFGVKIAQFSRFVPQSVQNEQIRLINEGKIHLIVGTHRLLSKEITIPNLRLLIVDEEQRFGVEHKERIKEVSRNIDILTLTATPIPRTLQMSLLGIRNLSQLQSAPSNRMPIQTYVLPKSDSLIKEAIERELARKGQVYYLHNKTSSIFSTVKKIENMIKGARVDAVHGKMDKEEIEITMSKFYNGEIDVLVCTSIIETGLDISNCNTILIENADCFGLSQLYQIKGRVGRSNRIAYAYLMYEPKKDLSEVSQKRLKAIKDFTELGSGFKIAQRDLSIRGAGDILGPEQAGFIDTIGIDMYIKLLSEAIKEKQGIVEEKDKVNITNLSLNAYIPKDYATDGDKLEIYQEIQGVSTLTNLEIFKNKIRDIYGRIPNEMSLLITKRKIDILSSSSYIDKMEEEGDYIIVLLTKEASLINKIGLYLFDKLGSLSKFILASFVDRQIKLKLKKTNLYLEQLEKLLVIIDSTCKENI